MQRANKRTNIRRHDFHCLPRDHTSFCYAAINYRVNNNRCMHSIKIFAFVRMRKVYNGNHKRIHAGGEKGMHEGMRAVDKKLTFNK